MRKLGVIQDFLGNFLLSFRTKRIHRNPKVYTFENAETIGLLYDAKSEKIHKQILDYVNFLKQNHHEFQIHTLGFVGKELEQKLVPNANSTFFTEKDFSWTGNLQKGNALDFIKKDFNILIDLTTETVFPLTYITRASKASYKIGRYIADDLRYDLMIDTKKENTIEYLITQINVYLTQIKVTK